MRSRQTLVLVGLVAIVSAVLTWLVGQQIESPTEVAARTAPPDASLISVPVEFRILESAVVTRGTIGFDETVDIQLLAVEDPAVVTGFGLQEGDALSEGSVLVEISGRPVLVLEGEFPPFRDFVLGLEGPDVLQLEEALERLGVQVGPVDGRLDSATSDSIRALYRSAGHAPPELAKAQRALTDVQRQAGTVLPASELMFVPSLPRTVQSVNIAVGDVVMSGPLVSVSSSALEIVSSVNGTDRDLLAIGMAGVLGDPITDSEIGAEISFIAEQPGGDELASDRFEVRLTPVDDVPSVLLGQNLRVSIPISSSGGEVLTVPLAALSASADGSSRVERLIGDDVVELVVVNVGLAANGFAAVEPVQEDALDADDRVVVGRNNPGDLNNSSLSEDEAADDR